jgi:hypothetical protein
VIGLAEARGLDPAAAAGVIERLADSLEACAEDLAAKGQLVEGAARVAAEVSPAGVPSGLALRTAPGSAVMANALLCFVTPFKLAGFPVADEGSPTRGLALEATWGPQPRAAAPPDSPDGGR